MKIYYKKYLNKYTKEKRKFGTLAEILLWNELKQRKIRNYRFTRQKPVGNFIVDFYCGKLKLVIEVDGFTHELKYKDDNTRDIFLTSIGLNVIRFNDEDILKNINWVLDQIFNYVENIEKFQKTQPPKRR